MAATLVPRDNEREDTNLLSRKRTLILERIPGQEEKVEKSLINTRLFDRGNAKIYAEQDPQFSLWAVHYDAGILPAQLQQKFTSFPRLYDYVSKYFETRGIRIATVID